MSSKNFFSYTNNSFNLAITKLDTVQRIISGNFFGTLYKKEGYIFTLSDTLRIQSGRFDVKYINY